MELGVGLPTCGPVASPEAIGRVAEQAERIGLATVWTFERLLRPTEPIPLGGAGGPVMMAPEMWATIYDPLETLGYVAARTSRIGLGTCVLDTLFHSPVVLARRLATLDRLSGGRLLVGLGQGWMEQEFTAAGVPLARRGAGFQEHLEAMRAIWGPDPVRFQGRFYRVPESEIGPKPVRAGGPPLLVGASAPSAVERAARLGVGLAVVMFSFELLRDAVTLFRGAAEAAGHDPAALPVVVQVNGPVTAEPLDERAPLTGSVEQVASDLAQLGSLDVDQVFWSILEIDPDQQLRGIELLGPGGAMIDQHELDATARAIVDANLYMVLGTVDRDGRPWVSPVYYATADYQRFYWISSPEVRHSRNLAERPDTSIVIFDSRVPAYTGQAVYMSAMAEELAGDDLERGLEVYPGAAERGGRTVTAAEVRPPAPYRLYRATASQHSILCPWPSGPCPVHGPAHDHRVAVNL